jgi:DNA-binding NarL/FixJ family response regulator
VRKIRIVVADDHPIVRDGLRSMLSAVDDFEVVGEAASGPEAVVRVRDTDPDVVVMDLRMPGGDGVAPCASCRPSAPAPPSWS